MKKCNCKDCICLIDCNGKWVCDETQKPIEKIEECPEKDKE